MLCECDIENGTGFVAQSFVFKSHTASTELAAASPKMGPAWMRGGRDVTAAVGTSDDIRVIIQTYVRT